MLLHHVATVGAKSPPGNIERSEEVNDLTFGQALAPVTPIDRG